MPPASLSISGLPDDVLKNVISRLDLESVQSLACCDQKLRRTTRASVVAADMIEPRFCAPSARALQPYSSLVALPSPPVPARWHAPACVADGELFTPYLQWTHARLASIDEAFSGAYRGPQQLERRLADTLACLPFLPTLAGRVASSARSRPSLALTTLREMMENRYANPIALEACLEALELDSWRQLSADMARECCLLGATYLQNIPSGLERSVPRTILFFCSYIDFLPHLRASQETDASSRARLLSKLCRVGALTPREVRSVMTVRIDNTEERRARRPAWWPAEHWPSGPWAWDTVRRALEWELGAFDRSLGALPRPST